MAEPGVDIVDCHVHVFPPEVVSGRELWKARDAWFGALYGNPKSRLTSAEDLIAAMDGAGVATSVVCGFPWRDLSHCREHNDYLADAARRYPDRVAWLGI